MTEPAHPPFPFCCRNVRNNLTGVATGLKCVRGYYYYKVCRVMRDDTQRTDSAWSVKAVIILPDIKPEDMGFVVPKSFARFYARNALTGSVGIACGKTLQNKRDAYWIETTLGNRGTRWYIQNTFEITKEEYDASDKVSKRAWNRDRKMVKQLTGKERKCRDCSGPIVGPNWWFCPNCHSKRMLKVAYKEAMYVNAAYPADVSPLRRSEI